MSAIEILDRRIKWASAATVLFALAGIAAVWWSTRPPG
jgi:hypothetical protein